MRSVVLSTMFSGLYAECEAEQPLSRLSMRLANDLASDADYGGA